MVICQEKSDPLCKARTAWVKSVIGEYQAAWSE